MNTNTTNEQTEWRPLEPGELIQEGDEILRHGTGPWEPAETCLGLAWGDYIHEGRTRRPRPATPSDAPTPETDAETYSRLVDNDEDPLTYEHYVEADFARRLERERNQWKESCFKADEICLEVMRERDAARAELAKLKTTTPTPLPVCEYWVGEGFVDSGGGTPLGEGINIPYKYLKMPSPAPPPDGSAVEWVRELLYTADGRNRVLDEDDAIELARRCDLAEDNARQSREEIEALKGDVAAAQARKSEDLESDSIVAACNCMTKTPEAKYHKPGCKYRLIAERDAAQAEAAEMRKQRDMCGAQVLTLTAEIKRLRKGVTEIKAGTRIGWFMTDLGAKCQKLLNP